VQEQSRIVAITGATGFLGSNIAESLLADGVDVHIFARDKDKAKQFEGRAARIVIGEIDDQQALEQLVEGASDVIHLVSNFRTVSGLAESYERINVEGTRVVLAAAEKAGVKRFVHCSTIGVHGDVLESPSNEQSPYNPGDLYQSTKLEAEKLAQTALEKSAMEVVIIRPCSMYGPGDVRMLKMFRMLKKRTFFLVGPCRDNFHALYINDAVAAFKLALNSPAAPGQIFIVGGVDGYLPLKDYIRLASEAVGAPMPWLKFPYWFFYSAAIVCEAIFVPLRIEPPLHRRRVKFFKNDRAFDTQKAVNVLGFKAGTNLRDGMRNTVNCCELQ